MSDTQGSISIAFLLALSVAAASKAGAAVDLRTDILRPGNLRDVLAREGVAGDDASARNFRAGDRRIAQGCAYNYWRRC